MPHAPVSAIRLTAFRGEAVSVKEWFDVIVELPEKYHGLIPPHSA